MLLFALGATRELGTRVSAALGLGLSEHEEREFEDGEHKARPLVSVRGRDVYVIHSLCGDARQSVNDKLCRLLFFIGALKDASAARVTALVPYLAYARKDRRSQPRDPVTTRYVATMFEAAGVDCLVALDVHNVSAFENAFRCRTEHLEAADAFAAELAPQLDGDVVVVSPDAGGVKRAEQFRVRMESRLGRPVGGAFVEKHRARGVLSGGAFVGDVAGSSAIVVDDLISAGNTVARASEACLERGARRVLAVATHGVFAGEANAVLGASGIDRILVSDSVSSERLLSGALRERLTTVSVAPLFAEAARRLHRSLGE